MARAKTGNAAMMYVDAEAMRASCATTIKKT